MEMDEERGQKHEKLDDNMLSPPHARARTPSSMNNGLPSKRKSHNHPLLNLSSSNKATKIDLTSKTVHGLQGSTVVGSAIRGRVGEATLSPRLKKRKVWKPKSSATVLPATTQMSNKKNLNAAKSTSSKSIGRPNRTLHDSKVSKCNIQNGRNQLQRSNENCICVPSLESFESLNGSTKTLDPNTLYSVDIGKEPFSSKVIKDKYVFTDLSRSTKASISNHVIGNPLVAGRLPVFQQIPLCKVSNNDDDERFKSPSYPKSFPLSYHISPVKLASLYSNESDEGISHSPKTQADHRIKPTSASDKSNRYFVSKTSRRSFPELWRRVSRGNNLFSNTTPRKTRSCLSKSSKSYYTESLDEKIYDIERKRNIPFLEFSIISLESKLNQALLDLQDRDQKIALLSQQLNESKRVSGDVEKDNAKPIAKMQQNLSLSEAQLCGEGTGRQSEFLWHFSDDTMVHHSLEQTSYHLTTKASTTEQDMAQLSRKEQVATQTSTNEMDLNGHCYLSSEQMISVTQQLRELQHGQKTMQEEIKNTIRTFFSGRCDMCNKDCVRKVSMESLLLPYIKEQVQSSANELLVHLARSHTASSAQALPTLERKVERSNANMKSYRIKSEQERYKVATVIKKVIHNLERVKKKIEGGSLGMHSCGDYGISKAVDEEKLSQGLVPLQDMESWEQFSRRFRLALEGKLPDPDRKIVLDDGRRNRVNTTVQSKAKSLLLELSFERDGSPIGLKEHRTPPCAFHSRTLDNSLDVDCTYDEAFVDAKQQMS